MSALLFKSEKTCALDELTDIPVRDNDEPFVALSETDLQFTLVENGLAPATGAEIYVRAAVAQQLEKANAALGKDYTLDICYGYRSPEIQENKFRSVLDAKVQNEARRASYMQAADLRAEWIASTHNVIAAPEVAGHPTGGAVDVRLRDRFNRVVDMGTQIHDIATPLCQFVASHHYDFTPAWQRQRLVLREAMCDAGFAPFNGEWWHFSSGDKEAAALKGEEAACYAQRQLNAETGEVRGYNPMSAHDILSEILDKRNLPQLKA
jgi:D-alanyl-D-alanine dipeptidase